MKLMIMRFAPAALRQPPSSFKNVPRQEVAADNDIDLYFKSHPGKAKVKKDWRP